MKHRCGTVLFILLTRILLVTKPIHGLALQSLPTSLRLNQVSQSYPETLFRTLFSSVPRREFAVHNITLEVKSQLLQILGSSSSGKSTILRLVLGQEESPITGSVSWIHPAIRPVYLEQGKSPYAYESSQSVETILTNICSEIACDTACWEEVVRHVCEIVGLSSRELLSAPSKLSPSNLYRFGLARASLESILPALHEQDHDYIIPSPLLLLDEWMDLETSAIVGRVEESMLNLTRHGAVILCVTHKPQLFSKPHRSITMCRGEILFESSAE